eukprot:scaffold435303_cov42-Prasinocladus_malaysianus.AAC.3
MARGSGRLSCTVSRSDGKIGYFLVVEQLEKSRSTGGLSYIHPAWSGRPGALRRTKLVRYGPSIRQHGSGK